MRNPEICQDPLNFGQDDMVLFSKIRLMSKNLLWHDFFDTDCKVSSSNTSRLEAHDVFQIAYEGDFRSLYTVTFWQKVDFLISNAS